ncbi:MAG TPA: GNAT family N-acetyltransferase [Ktedonobacterales bacterium]|nr:GNAT family N-acetyltransferase [Ktedonobacterales bacterium]
MDVFLMTTRLILRRFTDADMDNLVELDSDPEVMRYLNGGIATPRSVIERTTLPRFIQSSERRDGSGLWAAIERTTGAFVGWFSFQPGDEADPEIFSLGYRLRRSAWGRGYATEGVRALIRKGFVETNVQRLVATTYQDNLGSRRVMEKSGLRLARAFRLTSADLVTQSDTFVPSGDVWDGDDVEYELTRADWERQEAAREEER